MYCLKLDGTGAEDNISVIERTKGSISSAEIQIEKLGNSSFEEIGKIIKNADIPVTVSSRADESLGENTKELLLSAAERGAAYIDTDNRDLLSDEEFIMKVRSFGAHMIYSLYYNGVPDNLWEEVDSAYRFASRAVSRCASAFPAASRSVLQPGCVVKAVCLLRGVEDALGLCRTADRLSHIERKLILGEGEYALFSHLLYRRLGSLWGYIYPEWGEIIEEIAEQAEAEVPEEMPEIFGIIGNPVAHSKSPRIHNRWLKSLGLNAVYIPFLVDDPAAFFRLAEVLPIEGFSVTLPHKEKVIPFLHRLEHPVKKIGACNTVFRKEGKWVGTNTDYEGFLSPIETLLREGSIQSALVIGAGGAARTVVHALCDRGVRVQICNRTAVKAEELAKEAGCGHVLQEEVNSSGPYDLVVQTTNVGMEPDIEGDPLPGYRFTGRETVYDIIYTPEKTVFLRRAEERGCKIIGGAQMLRKQAEAQFRIFTGGMNPPDY